MAFENKKFIQKEDEGVFEDTGQEYSHKQAIDYKFQINQQINRCALKLGDATDATRIFMAENAINTLKSMLVNYINTSRNKAQANNVKSDYDITMDKAKLLIPKKIVGKDGVKRWKFNGKEYSKAEWKKVYNYERQEVKRLQLMFEALVYVADEAGFTKTGVTQDLIE